MPSRAEQNGRSRDGLVLAAAVARRHYLGHESKVDIAQAMAISRFKVARLLDQAHEAGLVRIEVVDPVGADSGLEGRLRERWGLAACVVVPTHERAPAVREEVGRAAADLLGRILGPGDVLGLPWSRSVHAMVNMLRDLPPVPIVQLSGALAAEDSSSVDVVRRAARVAGGGRQVFFAPLVMPDEQAAEAVRRDVAVRDTLAAASSVTVAMVGVGAWAPGESSVYDAVDDATREKVATVGVVGESCGVFFDAAGGVLELPLSQRIVALSGDQLQAIPTVVASSQHVARVPALRAALHGGLVGGLVVTQDVAEALLAE